MATEKTFAVAGVSTQNGSTKIRFANDAMRVKVLAKNGHTDIDLIDLPREMTKAEIAQYFIEINFADGRPEVEEAIADLEDRISFMMSTVAGCQREDAIRYLHDVYATNGDVEYLEHCLSVPFGYLSGRVF